MGLVAAVGTLLLVLTLSIALGSRGIPLPEVLSALTRNTGQDDAYVIWEMRIPRTAAGFLVGVALALSGALIQALTRNPLADPGILGVNAGAAFFVAFGTALFGISSIDGYAWLAFAGALTVTVSVYLVGSGGFRRAGADPVQLTLAGVALAALLGGITTGIVLLDLSALRQMRSWSAGSIVDGGWDVLLPMIPFLAIGVLLAAFAASALNSIALGDDLAISLGVNIIRTRIVVIIAVTLLAGGATAIAGPIGFVGLMVPHISRWIVGPDQRWILSYSFVLGPVLLLTADLIGRLVMQPGEVPVGIVTAFVGAPVLIALVRRRKASAL